MTPAGDTLNELFLAACQIRQDDEMFADASLRLTGGEAAAQAAAFAAGLRDQGFLKEDVVAVLSMSSVPHAIAFFGCQLAGVIPCCLHVNDLPARLKRNIDFIGAKAVLADEANYDKVEALETGLPILKVSASDESFYRRSVGAFEGAEEVVTAAPGDTALYLMSSGTTGDPKCIVHTQATLAATALQSKALYDCEAPGDSTIGVMAPSFAAWIHTVLPFTCIGGRIYFSSQFSPDGFLQLLQDEKITCAPLVPTVWRMVLAAGPDQYDLLNTKGAFYSGEPGTPDLIQALAEQITPNVLTAYLASEGGNAAGVAAGPDILSAPDTAASTGRPVPGAEVRVIDPDGGVDDLLPAGELGEIAVCGASLAAGYLNNPALTAERFSGGWWRTGDLGVLDDAGRLFVKGRVDNQINTGGIKVRAEEIEAALLSHPAVKLAGVVGEPDEQWGERIEAHLVAETALTSEDILDYLKENELLPRHLLPKAIYFRDTLPTGPTGKLYRQGLRSGG
ncbi:MAG: class I adenylate-forming enzyme family protein [Rhodospirillaceae bacterium]